MKTWIASLAALLLCSVAEGRQPNVVVLFMDDVGYRDVRSYDAKDVRTPHIDRLARDGVRLTECYAAAPVCSPTRTAFMTGRYQHRVRLESVLTSDNADQGLPATEETLPRILTNAGYATAVIGKWHLRWKPEFSPNRHGFDDFFEFLSSAIDYYSSPQRSRRTRSRVPP